MSDNATRFTVKVIAVAGAERPPVAELVAGGFLDLELAKNTAYFVSLKSKVTTYVMNCRGMEAVFVNGREVKLPFRVRR